MRDDNTEILFKSGLRCAAESNSSMERNLSFDDLNVDLPLKRALENSRAQRVVPGALVDQQTYSLKSMCKCPYPAFCLSAIEVWWSLREKVAQDGREPTTLQMPTDVLKKSPCWKGHKEQLCQHQKLKKLIQLLTKFGEDWMKTT
ncbi:hypothetical protein DPMN_122507 [Dreissena polymorpha]|uniref:Uncharacterized protein n=1 Tax=Dreissena polymorpha TaxID=45954 RepID=A0A9D4JU93_DREPO|nr:hypothetical protein DPMN_122507 [Dreissena polymorpha]